MEKDSGVTGRQRGRSARERVLPRPVRFGLLDVVPPGSRDPCRQRRIDLPDDPARLARMIKTVTQVTILEMEVFAAHFDRLRQRDERQRQLTRMGNAAGAAGLLEAALEALHPATRVHQLLLARVERVAGGADLDVQVRLRRARVELVAAGAAHVRQDVLGMDLVVKTRHPIHIFYVGIGKDADLEVGRRAERDRLDGPTGARVDAP